MFTDCTFITYSQAPNMKYESSNLVRSLLFISSPCHLNAKITLRLVIKKQQNKMKKYN